MVLKPSSPKEVSLRRLNRKLVLFAIALVLVAGMAGGLYWRWSTSPRYALQQMALALKTRDMKKFFSYVDLKAVFNNLIDSSDQDLTKPKGEKEDEWTGLSRQMGRKFARLFLPKIFESFEKDIRSVLEKQLLSLDNTKILAIAAAATTAKIAVRGEEAQVTLVDPKTKEKLRFEMQRQPQTGVWQIVSVNYQDLKKFTKRKFKGS
jgi:hypothetical protein